MNVEEYFKKCIENDPDFYAKFLTDIFTNKDNDVTAYDCRIFKNPPEAIDDLDLIKIGDDYFDRKTLVINFRRYSIEVNSSINSTDLNYGRCFKDVINTLLKGNYNITIEPSLQSKLGNQYQSCLYDTLQDISNEDFLLLKINYPEMFVKIKKPQETLQEYFETNGFVHLGDRVAENILKELGLLDK